MGKKSRLHNARRNIIWLLINRIITVLLPFATRTVIIYYLGSIYLGLNSLFSSILSILSLAELGFGSALVFSMYNPIAKANIDEVCALLNLYRKVYRIIGLIVCVIGLSIVPFLRYLIKGEIPPDINLYVLYFIFLFDTVISYFLFAYKESLLIADQRSDISTNVLTVIKILLSATQIIILTISKNYYFYIILIPLFSIIKNLVTSYIVDRKYPLYKCKGSLPYEKVMDIKKRVAGLFIYKICYVFRDSFDSIIISAYLGLIILAKYNNYIYISTAITGILTTIKTSITASIGNSIITETVEKNYHDFEKIQLLYMWISGWCSICLLCLYQPFIELWIGKEYQFDSMVMIVFVIYFFCYKMGDICAVYRHSIGLWWQDRYRPIVESVVNLSLNVFLVNIWGVSGVLISTILCLVFINAIWASRILYKHYFIYYSQIKYIIKLIFYSSITILAAIPTYLICNEINIGLIMNIIIRFSICLVIPNTIFLIFLKHFKEFDGSLSLVKRILRR